MRDAVEYKDLRTIHYFFIEEYTEKEVKLLRKAVAGTWSNVMKTPDGFFLISFMENMDIYFELEIGDIIEVCLGRASLHKKLSYESVMIRKKFKNTDLLIDGCLVEKCNDSEDHLIKFDTINSDVSNYLWSLTGFIYYLKNLSSGRSYILCPHMAYASITQYSVWYLSGKQLVPSIEYNLEREKKMKKEDLSWGNITKTELEVMFEFRRLQRELYDYRDNSSEGPLPLLFAKIAAVGYAANVNSSHWYAPLTGEYEARRSRAMRVIEYLQTKQIDDLINNTSLGHLLRFDYKKHQKIAPDEGMVSDIKEGFLYLANIVEKGGTPEKFWDMIINSGFEYEKDELKKRAQLFIDSLNA